MDLPSEAMRLLNDRNTTVTLATTAHDGTVNVATIRAFKAPEPNIIVLAQPGGTQIDNELSQHLKTGRLVSLLCVLTGGQRETAYELICSVKEFQTAGPLYEKFLDALRVRSIDLNGAWILVPVDVIDRSSS
ncbi:MAG TPA: hypothetical protein VEG65_07365 [Candidatus Bathyarchaeia archaeon]|nr:hypothetical protein [Candidatus Bathyarchaeia archaeon]